MPSITRKTCLAVVETVGVVLTATAAMAVEGIHFTAFLLALIVYI